MSVEEDTELRDLISQTLEANGCFAKIRAQLRANIYLALDEDDTFQKREFLPNKKLHAALETMEGKMMFCIVREFLEHFDLEFTISVFEPESYMGLDYNYTGRYKLIEDLNIPDLKEESSEPILLQLLQHCKLATAKSNEMSTTDSSVSSMNCKNSLLSQSSYNVNDSIIMATNDSDMSKKSLSSNSVHRNILNETFDIKTHNQINNKSVAKNNKLDEDSNSKSEIEQSLNEELLIDFDKSVKIENVINKSSSEKSKSLIDQSIVDTDFSPPVVRDSKYSKFDTSFDKLKLSSSKSEKIKVKNNLASLADLSPLQTSKSRTNDMLLPSLYTKEFKEKNNAKDIVEPLDNYDEDFISESDVDLTTNKEICKTNISKLQEVDKNTVDIVSNLNIDYNISLEDETSKQKKTKLDNNSSASSVTSEDFEINSNIDDILNSC